MSRRNDGEPEARGVLRPAPGFDATQMELSPEEAFLLSRLDGSTPWELLVESSGFAPEWAEACLSRWLDAGAVQTVAGAVASGSPNTTTSTTTTSTTTSTTTAVGVDAKTQNRVIEFESRLGGTYHQILGIDAGADQRAIKQAYFRLSREFHPDRFFRAELGAWGERLSLIFKTILGAYEALTRPGKENSRSSENELDASSSPRPTQAAGEEAGFEKLRRLEQRTLHTVPRPVLEERSKKAESFFDAAQIAEREGRADEASANLRMAVVFDPGNLGYRISLREMLRRIEQGAAAPSRDDLEVITGRSAEELAVMLKSIEGMIAEEPGDAALYERGASVALACNDLRRALAFARVSVERSPEVARHHTTLARVHAAKGHTGHARREFELALERDPLDREARRGLDGLAARGLSQGVSRG
jgi:tetratricopeptide (TPR) repeat protein